jgi:hypothetical protein
MVSARPPCLADFASPTGYPMTRSLSLAPDLERIANATASDATAASQVSLTGIAARLAKNLGVR